MPENVKGVALQRYFETRSATMAEAVRDVGVSTTYISKWLKDKARDVQPIGRTGNATRYGYVQGSGQLDPDWMDRGAGGQVATITRAEPPVPVVDNGHVINGRPLTRSQAAALATFMLGEAITLRVIAARLVEDHVEYELADDQGHVFTLGAAA